MSYDRAIKSGAESLSEPMNYFWGTRSALIKFPFGYRRSFNQIVENVSPEEIARRAKEFFSSLAAIGMNLFISSANQMIIRFEIVPAANLEK